MSKWFFILLFLSANNVVGQNFLERGNMAFGEGKLREAIRWFDWAIAADNVDSERYLLRAQANRAFKQNERALSDLQTAIQLNPTYGDAYFLMALISFEKGDFQSSIIQNTKALSFGTKYVAQARLNRAHSYSRARLSEKAIQDIDTLIAVQGPDVGDYYFERGQLKLQAGDKKSAIPDFKEVVRRNPTNIQLTWDIGRLSYEIDDFETAIEYYSRAIAKIPDPQLAVYMVRGETYEKLKRYKEAIADYTLAIEKNRSYADAYYSRGQAKARNADKKGACVDWIKASELGHIEASSVIVYNCE